MIYTIVSFPFLFIIKLFSEFSSTIIEDKLFLSSFPILKSELNELKRKWITLSINLSSELYEFDYKKKFYEENWIKTKIFKVKDWYEVSEDILKEVYELIDHEIENWWKVNVNCALWHSRSYSCILYYLSKKNNLSFEESENYVKWRRKWVWLNKRQTKSMKNILK